MINITFGFQENLGAKTSEKFDSINFDLLKRIFVLCDGANSTPDGGHASKLSTSTILEILKSSNDEINLKTLNAYNSADEKLKLKFKEAACTGISAEILQNGIFLASCGDSLIEVYKYKRFWGWKKSYASKLDLLKDEKSPSQLIGSPAYNKPNLKFIDARGSLLILLMSDGLYRFTTGNDRLKIIKTISKFSPSEDDLTFLASELSEVAIKNKSLDDISIGIVWLNYK